MKPTPSPFVDVACIAFLYRYFFCTTSCITQRSKKVELWCCDRPKLLRLLGEDSTAKGKDKGRLIPVAELRKAIREVEVCPADEKMEDALLDVLAAVGASGDAVAFADVQVLQTVPLYILLHDQRFTTRPNVPLCAL